MPSASTVSDAGDSKAQAPAAATTAAAAAGAVGAAAAAKPDAPGTTAVATPVPTAAPADGVEAQFWLWLPTADEWVRDWSRRWHAVVHAGLNAFATQRFGAAIPSAAEEPAPKALDADAVAASDARLAGAGAAATHAAAEEEAATVWSTFSPTVPAVTNTKRAGAGAQHPYPRTPWTHLPVRDAKQVGAWQQQAAQLLREVFARAPQLCARHDRGVTTDAVRDHGVGDVLWHDTDQQVYDLLQCAGLRGLVPTLHGLPPVAPPLPTDDATGHAKLLPVLSHSELSAAAAALPAIDPKAAVAPATVSVSAGARASAGAKGNTKAAGDTQRIQRAVATRAVEAAEQALKRVHDAGPSTESKASRAFAQRLQSVVRASDVLGSCVWPHPDWHTLQRAVTAWHARNVAAQQQVAANKWWPPSRPRVGLLQAVTAGLDVDALFAIFGAVAWLRGLPSLTGTPVATTTLARLHDPARTAAAADAVRATATARYDAARRDGYRPQPYSNGLRAECTPTLAPVHGAEGERVKAVRAAAVDVSDDDVKRVRATFAQWRRALGDSRYSDDSLTKASRALVVDVIRVAGGVANALRYTDAGLSLLTHSDTRARAALSYDQRPKAQFSSGAFRDTAFLTDALESLIDRDARQIGYPDVLALVIACADFEFRAGQKLTAEALQHAVELMRYRLGPQPNPHPNPNPSPSPSASGNPSSPASASPAAVVGAPVCLLDPKATECRCAQVCDVREHPMNVYTPPASLSAAAADTKAASAAKPTASTAASAAAAAAPVRQPFFGHMHHGLKLYRPQSVWEAPWSPAKMTRVDLDVPGARVFKVDQLLTENECRHYLAQANAVGWGDLRSEFDAAYRSNDRVLCMSPELADVLWSRLELVLQPRDVVRVRPVCFGNGGTWRPVRVNECMKFGRYRVGSHFSPHCDGPWVPRADESSVYTVVIYLNDQFQGGHTRFVKSSVTDSAPPVTADAAGDGKAYVNYDFKVAGVSGAPDPDRDRQRDALSMAGLEVARVTALTGSALIFNHDILHEGMPVLRGTKFLLRTEIMFKRVDTDRLPATLKSSFMTDTSYLRMVSLYRRSDAAKQRGDVKEFTNRYLDALDLQMRAQRTVGSDWDELFNRQRLPHQLYLHIFSYLSHRQVVALFAVSRVWYDFAADGALWQPLYARRWPVLTRYEAKVIDSQRIPAAAAAAAASATTAAATPPNAVASAEKLARDINAAKAANATVTRAAGARAAAAAAAATTGPVTATKGKATGVAAATYRTSLDYRLDSHMSAVKSKLKADAERAAAGFTTVAGRQPGVLPLRGVRSGASHAQPHPTLKDWYGAYKQRTFLERYFEVACVELRSDRVYHALPRLGPHSVVVSDRYRSRDDDEGDGSKAVAERVGADRQAYSRFTSLARDFNANPRVPVPPPRDPDTDDADDSLDADTRAAAAAKAIARTGTDASGHAAELEAHTRFAELKGWAEHHPMPSFLAPPNAVAGLAVANADDDAWARADTKGADTTAAPDAGRSDAKRSDTAVDLNAAALAAARGPGPEFLRRGPLLYCQPSVIGKSAQYDHFRTVSSYRYTYGYPALMNAHTSPHIQFPCQRGQLTPTTTCDLVADMVSDTLTALTNGRHHPIVWAEPMWGYTSAQHATSTPALPKTVYNPSTRHFESFARDDELLDGPPTKPMRDRITQALFRVCDTPAVCVENAAVLVCYLYRSCGGFAAPPTAAPATPATSALSVLRAQLELKDQSRAVPGVVLAEAAQAEATATSAAAAAATAEPFVDATGTTFALQRPLPPQLPPAPVDAGTKLAARMAAANPAFVGAAAAGSGSGATATAGSGTAGSALTPLSPTCIVVNVQSGDMAAVAVVRSYQIVSCTAWDVLHAPGRRGTCADVKTAITLLLSQYRALYPDEFDPSRFQRPLPHLPLPTHASLQLVLSGSASQALRDELRDWVVALPAAPSAVDPARSLPACSVAFGHVFPSRVPADTSVLDFDVVQGGWVYGGLTHMRERCVFRELTPSDAAGEVYTYM